ncbi:MAG: peptidyl-prolyl cis-trans isomerase, partial [Rhodospirillales bacterium]|nr:peptidyl-prolyl cis-trans isomerase [Rhodospirillales bacterium]
TRYIEKRITDKTMQDGYQAFLKEAGEGREVRARHILTETKEQAMEVIALLDKGGDFAELAKTKSKGPSGPNGGDLGFFDQGSMVPEFSKAAFALKTGEYTKEPVETQFGWHVIKVEEARSKEPPSFEEVTPQIHADVSRKIGGELIESLREKATIKRFRMDGTEVPEEKK